MKNKTEQENEINEATELTEIVAQVLSIANNRLKYASFHNFVKSFVI